MLPVFQNQILTEPVCISDIHLEYVYVLNSEDYFSGELRPYWTFCYETEGQKMAVRINAVTGGNLANGE